MTRKCCVWSEGLQGDLKRENVAGVCLEDDFKGEEAISGAGG